MSSTRFVLRLVLSALFMLGVAGCTTTDPYSGQPRIDGATTAALAGSLALVGAAAYAVSTDNDDDYGRYPHHHYHDYKKHYHKKPYHKKRYHKKHYYGHKKRVRHPKKNITCYDKRRSCYKHNGHYSKKWTRRVYGRG